ncbi:MULTISPECIES: AfsR/SARP family transcriptional regulator [Streptomyces]|uniref:AfsR/SARP family transcriptional regulator n=1 Tax=Streptomyces TaxID=1883 RepID=UPI00099FE45F
MSAKAVLKLLSGFDFIYDGGRVTLPLAAQRLLAFLALQSDGMHRTVAAEQLWPDCDPSRASANLRSALCQARRARTAAVIEIAGPRLHLARTVGVDLHETWAQARTLAEQASPLPAAPDVIVGALGRELLPCWTDDWLTLGRERWDQMRVHALESLAQRMHDEQQYLAALEAALVATAIDPIRETAHRILIEVHIAEGNHACAVKTYQEYQALLQRELGVFPSPQMMDIVQGLGIPVPPTANLSPPTAVAQARTRSGARSRTPA